MRRRKKSRTPADPAPAGAGPIRTCIGCRSRRPRDELVSLACVDGVLRVGERNFGRGASICPTATCVSAAGASRAFSRAFRSDLADRVCADTLLGWLGNAAH